MSFAVFFKDYLTRMVMLGLEKDMSIGHPNQKSLRNKFKSCSLQAQGKSAAARAELENARGAPATQAIEFSPASIIA